MGTLCKLFSSSIGRKAVVAVAGLLLCGFLVTHLAGNLLLFVSEGSFNNYAKTLESNPLLPIAEVGLLALFLAHILVAVKLRWENKQARPAAYEAYKSKGGRSAGSRTMGWTAFLVFAFVVVHIRTFKFGPHEETGLYRLVMDSFQNPLYAGFYVLAMIGLMLHLSHGIQSGFQTLGLNHPRYTPLVRKAGMGFAFLVCAGFALIPIWAFLGGPR